MFVSCPQLQKGGEVLKQPLGCAGTDAVSKGFCVAVVPLCHTQPCSRGAGPGAGLTSPFPPCPEAPHLARGLLASSWHSAGEGSSKQALLQIFWAYLKLTQNWIKNKISTNVLLMYELLAQFGK